MLLNKVSVWFTIDLSMRISNLYVPGRDWNDKYKLMCYEILISEATPQGVEYVT